MKFLPALFLLATLPFLSAETLSSGLEQSQIKGLLVFELGNGSFASRASQMNATLIPAQKSFTIGFNQEVGPQMEAATSEVEKFMRIRHKEKLPTDSRIEFAFANKHSPKDGPSAAVVCALMAESIITGKEIDPGFAATGDMTATGVVQPVGGVTDKLRGAIEKDCSIVGIPLSNQASISDTYILEGIEPLYEIQIFTLETFEEASNIASVEREEDVQKALDEFTMVQGALKKNPKYIFNAKVREKLQTVRQLMPNHLSAKILLLHSMKKGPDKLSLLGSLNGIEVAASDLSIMVQNESYQTRGGSNDVLSVLVTELHRLRPRLDKRTLEYADANRDLAEFIRSIRSRKVWSEQIQREFNSVLSKVNSERDILLNQKEIQEELSGG